MRYELGGRIRFSPKITSEIAWKNKGGYEGVLAYARDERTGEYVRVYEVAPEQYVDGEPQAWSSGNYETVEAAKAGASKAYRWINKGKR